MMQATAIPVEEKWLARARQGECPFPDANSARALLDLRFPTTRDEEWKYTRTARLQQGEWPLRPALIHASGLFVEKTPQVPDVKLSFFETLNLAFCTNAWNVQFPAHQISKAELHIQTPPDNWAQPNAALRTEKNAQGSATVYFNGEKNGFTNGLIHVSLAEGSVLNLDVIQDNEDSHFQYLHVIVDQEANSKLNLVTHVLQGGWIRNQVTIRMNGSGSESQLSGHYLPTENQFVDNHTVVDHLYPHCVSRELYKGVAYDQGKVVFNGKVFVRPDAQKTEAYQSNQNIIISEQAVVNSKPELEIYADDVKCSHGSTTGQLDEEALFYLRARGLSEEGAKQMLVSAFVMEVIEKSGNPDAVSHVKKLLMEWGKILSDS